MKILQKISKAIIHTFPFLDRYRTFRQFVKFCLVGVTNMLIDFSIYVVSTRFFKIYYITANVIAFFVAVSWSFFFNKRWTFRDDSQKHLREKYVKFFIVNLLGLLIHTAILYFSVEFFHLYDIFGKLIAIVITAFWNFFASKLWVFGKMRIPQHLRFP